MHYFFFFTSFTHLYLITKSDIGPLRGKWRTVNMTWFILFVTSSSFLWVIYSIYSSHQLEEKRKWKEKVSSETCSCCLTNWVKAQTSKMHRQPFNNQLCIILWITGFDLHYSRGQLQRELLGIIAFPHRAWGLSVILTDMSFQGKKMYQIGSPDKSWQTNQKQTEIRLSNLRTASHIDWQVLQVTHCQATEGNVCFRL